MVGASAKVYGKFNLGIVEPDQLQQQQSINHIINSNCAKWMS
jgi:hypothetical protein